MVRYIVRRVLISIPVLVGISVITFAFANLAPGDPVTAMIDPQSGLKPSDVAAMKEALGLNQPLPLRYVIWLGQVVLHGNLGFSYITHRSVAASILERVPATLELMAAAMAISLVVGVSLGVYSAFHQYSWIDHLMTFVVFVGISVPSFFFALLAIYIFAFKIPIFPAAGISEPGTTLSPVVDGIEHLILPACVLGIEGTATYLRYTRASVLEAMRQDYVVTARAKGVFEWAVRFRHAFRNALLPLVTIVGLQIPGLIGGALFVELLFSWPGMARLAITSTMGRDYPMIMGLGVFIATLVLVSNLLVDIAYAAVDPRIHYG